MTDETELRASLDEALAPAMGGGLDPSDPADADRIEEERGSRWHIDGPSTASWALRKMGAAQHEREAVLGLYNVERARLDAWRDERLAKPERTMSFFEMELNVWFQAVREEDPARKSWTLPGGKVSVTRSQKIEIDDDVAFLAWAETEDAHVELVKVEKSPKKADLKKLLQKDPSGVLLAALTDGEVVPGISIAVEDNFRASPDMGAPPESSDEGAAPDEMAGY